MLELTETALIFSIAILFLGSNTRLNNLYFDSSNDHTWCNYRNEADRQSLIRRRGNANNEIGVYYMTTLQEIILTHQRKKMEGLEDSFLPSVEPFFNKSMSHLTQGIDDFAIIGDAGLATVNAIHWILLGFCKKRLIM